MASFQFAQKSDNWCPDTTFRTRLRDKVDKVGLLLTSISLFSLVQILMQRLDQPFYHAPASWDKQYGHSYSSRTGRRIGKSIATHLIPKASHVLKLPRVSSATLSNATGHSHTL